MNESIDFSALTPQKRRLVHLMLRRKGVPVSQLPILPRESEAGTAPSSFAQQRLWYLDQLEPGTAHFNLPSPRRLSGPLDVTALEWSLQEIVRRHEVLRTCFKIRDGLPLQVISPSPTGFLPLVDLGDLPPTLRRSEFERLAAQEALRPFQLSSGPLLRFHLLRLRRHEHALLLTLHHIVSDGWSAGVLWRELSALYEAFSAGKPSPLQPLPIQYADYAAWQRGWLEGKDLQKLLDYWKKQLAGLASLNLPTDRPRPSQQSFLARGLAFQLPEGLSRRLQALSRSRQTTLFTVLLALFVSLLYRYSGQKDVVVASPIANRNRAEIEGLIGYFINTLLLRARLEEGLSFEGLLSQLRETSLDAFDRQDLPFEKLVEELHPERDLSRQPLAQVMFQVQNAPRPPSQMGGLTLAPVNAGPTESNFDLALSLWEGGQGVEGQLVYCLDLFDSSTAQRLVQHFQRLAAGAIESPGLCPADLPLLGPSERHELLLEWDRRREQAGRPHCLQRLFCKQAGQRPHQTALRMAEQLISYGALERLSNRLARMLQGMGGSPQRPLALLMESGPLQMAGLLGILKAGRAFVCLDPSHPAARLRHVLQEAKPWLLWSGRRLHGKLLGQWQQQGGRLLLGAGQGWEGMTDAPMPCPADADAPAYVAFTSGSTGRPKGIWHTHASFGSFLGWYGRRFRLGPGQLVANWTAITFDPSYCQILGALCHGSTLSLTRREVKANPEAVLDWLQREGATLVEVVPSFARHLAQALESRGERLEALKSLNLVGEPLPGGLASRLMRLLGPSASLFNLYGPTETVLACCQQVSEADLGSTTVAVGRTISGCQALILDARGHLCPIGIPGEVYLRSQSAALGYFERGAETAQAFLCDGLAGAEPGGRLYRTGDVGRFSAQGRLELMGRIDQQVKIRGVRVETGEVESALGGHESVRECAVTVRRGDGEEPYLVAYVAGESAEEDALRRYLRQSLPEQYVPSDFVLLPSLPRNPNGKIDRSALPQPDGRPPAGQREWIAPRTPTEWKIARLWQELLGIDRVGRDDNFFDLGGHSLLATQAVNRLRSLFSVEMPLRRFIGAADLAQLASALEESRGGSSGPLLPILPRGQQTGPAPASYAQERMWFLDQFDADKPLYNLLYALSFKGRLEAAALQRGLNEIVRRHEVLRSRLLTDSGSLLQEPNPFQPFALAQADLRSLPPAQQERALEGVRQAIGRRFDLSKGRLWRACLLRLPKERHTLLWTAHHIVFDGWSMAVLYRELEALYGAFAAGRRSPLAELPVQYADYALWQRRRLQGEFLQEQLSYWTGRFAQPPPWLDLPADRPRPAAPTFRGAVCPVRLPADLIQGLEQLGGRGTTLYMTLLASLKALLLRYSGQTDLVVGTPIANRNRSELEGLIGFFVNTLALRTSLSGRPSFSQALQRVRETALGAYAHQDLPFARLVEELQPDRELARPPLFQVLLLLQNIPFAGSAAQGLKLTSLKAYNSAATLDLTFNLSSSPEGLRGEVYYLRDLFDRCTVQRLLRHWESLMRGALLDAELPLHELPLLQAAEGHQLLSEWQGSRASPQQACLHWMFEEQVKIQPNAVALRTESLSLSYAELDGQARRIAQGLRRMWPGQGQLAALLLRSGLRQVPALLGAFQAGWAYLCLDPASPDARLRHILAESSPSCLITEPSCLRERDELLNSWRQEGRLAVDSDLAPPNPDGALETAGQSSPGDLAFVVYTSGSTGHPKGIVQTQGAFSQFVDCYSRRLGLGPGKRYLLWASISYDAAYAEIFGALCCGATLCTASQAVRRDPHLLLRRARRERLTHLQFVPSFAGQLMQAMETEGLGLPDLEALLLAGEVLPADLARRWLERFPATHRLINLFGPTESVLASSHQVTEADLKRPSIPVGRPLQGRQLLVLDRCQQPCPIGVWGEIYIRSRFLAKGYLGRASETASAFLPDLLLRDPQVRTYRSGDLGRFLTEGSLEFLGRRDHQVKIRGMRVELGEVESVLGGYDGLAECAAAMREGPSGSPRLVAYLVRRQSPQDSVGLQGLKEFLRQRLPGHMVPSHFIFLEALPRTDSGKVDRLALPQPHEARGQDEPAIEGPQTALEEEIAQLWSELLDQKQVGREESFFDLGGHSLMATQVVNRLRKAYSVELPLRAFMESPTVAGLARRVESARQPAGGQSCLPIPLRSPEEQEIPLSFAQLRLWFLEQVEPGTALYNIPSSMSLSGKLDVAALFFSLNEIVRRHEVLRTAFSARGEEPLQTVRPHRRLAPPVIDLSGLNPQLRRDVALALAAQQEQRPFDLSRAPLLRAGLLRLAEQQHVLLLAFHHIASDGWSGGLLFDELKEIYSAALSGRAPALAELPIQYADFALWQRQRLQGRYLEGLLDYWKGKLKGLTVLELPTDHARPALQSLQGGKLDFRLQPDLSLQLDRLSRSQGATLFMTLLSGFLTLLFRYSGQSDLPVASPIAHRNRSEIEKLIGYFVNTLVLRADLSGALSFSQLLAQLRRTTLEAYDHQDLPFEKLVEELRPERDLSRQPLAQVMFQLQNTPRRPPLLPGLELAPLTVGPHLATFDLALSLWGDRRGISGELLFRQDLFELPTLGRMLGHYRNILLEAVRDADQSLPQMPLLAAAQRHQMLVEWRGNGERRGHPQLLHSLFAEQARRQPHQMAVRMAEQWVSYAALDRLSNRLARRLIRTGGARQRPAALLMESSPLQIAALLGILKAGRAFVCLDPSHPTSRLRHVLQEARPGLLWSGPGLHPELQRHWQQEGGRLLQGAGKGLQGHSDAPVDGPGDADGPAYVAFTSGSTGRPKGIWHTHASFGSFLRWYGRRFRLGPGQLVANWTAITFDPSYCQIFGALCHGAALSLTRREVKADPLAAADWLLREGATLAEVVPSFALHLAEALESRGDRLEAMKSLNLVGEPLPCRLASRLMRLLGPSGSLFNLYGPTETVLACCQEASQADLGRSTVAVGRPIWGCQALLMDARGELCPLGVYGQVWLRSESAALGYFERGAETAQAFACDGFAGAAPGGRIYRTGDVGRMLADGRLQLLGRVDQQVKIRGVRVEAGEVESALSAHESVRECAVMVRQDDGQEPALVAYVAGESVQQDSLRRFLRQSLPEQFVPSDFILLPSLARNPNGKIDRAALPQPRLHRCRQAAGQEPPQTLLEKEICAIWQELLKLDRVGRQESFFDLGGHSLLAARLVNRLKERYGQRVPLLHFFGAPTIAGLAQWIESQGGKPRHGQDVADKVSALLDQVRRLPKGELEAMLSRKREQLLKK